MRRTRRLTAAILGAIWLLPSVAVCAVGLHLALEHHHHDHAHHHGANVDHASATELVQVALHGHRHEAAESDDHSHYSTTTPAPPTAGASFAASTISRTPVARLVETPVPCSDAVCEHAPPPLFTAHCSLLI